MRLAVPAGGVGVAWPVAVGDGAAVGLGETAVGEADADPVGESVGDGEGAVEVVAAGAVVVAGPSCRPEVWSPPTT